MTRRGRVVVVGLGPAGADLVLPAARHALERIPARFVRTTRHPAVDELRAAGLAFDSFDDRYDAAPDFEAVYGAIADAVSEAAAANGEVVYAVPGSPAVAERTVVLLRDLSARGLIDLEVLPGLSFAELAWTKLGVDPMQGAHVVDAQEFAVAAAGLSGPLLVGHCWNRLLLSDVKLALLDVLAPKAEVVVLQRLGLATEAITGLPLSELDRAVEPDHLTSVFVDLGDRAPAQEYVRLLELAARLRAPGGCPWDAEQTHHSLTRYLLEEAYEVVETVEALPVDAPAGVTAGAELPGGYARLEDELGDLLYQIVFHALLAQEAGAFTMADVAHGIHDKLVRRHPHVFGPVEADTSEQVIRNWEQIKKAEKGEQSIVAGITAGLPSLLYAHKLYRKAASVGLEPGSAEVALERIATATAALATAGDADVERRLGELLAGTVVLARARGVDAETSLRAWSARFRARFEEMERLAASRGVELGGADAATVEALWADVAGSRS
ncbi:MAG: nucleoside triphosphate pyrophosphohydrolase [Acidimicrobiia bacterium]